MLGPCRLPYELIASDISKETPKQTLDKGYLLSTKDLCGLEYIPELINAGVTSLKIEGRMKTPEYVATVTRIYRKYIDLALSNKPYKIDNKDIEDLLQVFNRGNFSSGHLDKKPNRDLVYKEKQNHMGIYIGNIASLKPNKGHVFINLKHSVSLGDTIQFEKEDVKYTISELMLKNKNILQANNGQLVEIGRMKGNLHIGDKVYRVNSKELSNYAKSSYQEEYKKINLKAKISLKINEPIVLNVETIAEDNIIFDNINVSLSSFDVPALAKSKPIDKDRIISQLNKTNDTIFTFSDIEVKLDDNLFLPSIKILNELRRNALEEILMIAKDRIIRKSPKIEEYKLDKEGIDKTKTEIKKENKNTKKISVLLNKLNDKQNYEDLKNVDNIYIPLRYFSNKKYENIIKTISKHFNIYIYLPTIIKSNYKNLLHNVIENSIDMFTIKGFVISNLGNFTFIEELQKRYGNKFEYIGNYTLNVYNQETIKELKELGVKKLTISPELDKNTIENMLNFSSLEQELIVYGKTPLMHMNYCLLGNTNKCYPTCGVHCMDNKEYYLKDRLGLTFIVVPDRIQTVTTIYNSKTTFLKSSDFSTSSYRIDLLDETVEKANSIIEKILKGNRLEGNEYTNGNLNREI